MGDQILFPFLIGKVLTTASWNYVYYEDMFPFLIGKVLTGHGFNRESDL